MAVLIRAALSLCVLLAGTASPVGAQSATAPALTAAFLDNFAKFAAWPEDAIEPGHVFTFCVIGDRPTADALENSLKQAGSGPSTVMLVKPDGPLKSCQMLFLGGVDMQQARRILASVKGAPVFTVSGVDGFTEAGGVAQLRLDNGRIRFAINPAAAQRAHLALSAKLLNLATLVKDKPDADR